MKKSVVRFVKELALVLLGLLIVGGVSSAVIADDITLNGGGARSRRRFM